MRASKAWSSQDPEGVASCYEEAASLTINRGKRSTGRAELAATAADTYNRQLIHGIEQ